MIHHDDIFEQIGNLHVIPLRELGELMFPVKESLTEILSVEETRAEDDLPEV